MRTRYTVTYYWIEEEISRKTDSGTRTGYPETLVVERERDFPRHWNETLVVKRELGYPETFVVTRKRDIPTH